MKNKIKIFSMLMLTIGMLTFTACTSGKEKNDNANMDEMENMDNTKMNNMDASKKMMDAMNVMMTKMNSMEMTQDFDHNFAKMMIDHHEGAIEMAHIEIASGTDQKIKGMAEKMIAAQKSEQEKLKIIIANHKPVSNQTKAKGDHAEGGHNELMDAMKTNENSMKNMAMTGDVDKDFVMMMIPHHQSAISMADNEISHGHHVELKQMAQQMRVDQANEIKEMQMWLDNYK